MQIGASTTTGTVSWRAPAGDVADGQAADLLADGLDRRPEPADEFGVASRGGVAADETWGAGDGTPRPLTLDDLVGRPDAAGASATDGEGGEADEDGPNLLAEAQADLRADPSLATVEDDPATRADESDPSSGASGPDDELTPEEQAMVDELAARDREVRAHEQAHAAVGGALASSPTYTFQVGPDGKRYAVGGQVDIQTGPGRTPEETIQRAAQIRAAALAPADPSGQDRAIAAAAAAMAAEARAELAREDVAEAAPVDDPSAGGPVEAVAAGSAGRATEGDDGSPGDRTEPNPLLDRAVGFYTAIDAADRTGTTVSIAA